MRSQTARSPFPCSRAPQDSAGPQATVDAIEDHGRHSVMSSTRSASTTGTRSRRSWQAGVDLPRGAKTHATSRSLAGMTTAIYAGSFDPIHLGHLGTIQASARKFERVYVVVATNPSKRGGLFRVGERVALVAAATAELANVTVMEHHGLVVDAATPVRADVLVRTSGKERLAEIQMAYLNRKGAAIRTVLIAVDPMTAHISSTAVRELISHGAIHDVRPLVPQVVVDALNDITRVT